MGTATLFLMAVWAMDTAMGDTGTAMTRNTGTDTVMDMITTTDTDMIMDTVIHTKSLTAKVRLEAVSAYIAYGLWDFILFISVIFKIYAYHWLNH